MTEDLSESARLTRSDWGRAVAGVPPVEVSGPPAATPASPAGGVTALEPVRAELPHPLARDDVEVAEEVDLGPQLAEDALGLLFEGRRRSDGVCVRVRVLVPRLHGDAARFAAAVADARRWSGLAHVTLCTPSALGKLAGRHAIVSPRPAGEIARLPMSPASALHVILQLARGLAWAHLHGLAHGPIAPASLYVAGGEVVLADVGLSRAVAPDGALERSAPTARHDPRALSALLAHLVTGAPAADPSKVTVIGGMCRRLGAAADADEAIRILEAFVVSDTAPEPTTPPSTPTTASSVPTTASLPPSASSATAPLAPSLAPPTRERAVDWIQLSAACAALLATVVVFGLFALRRAPPVASPPPPAPPRPIQPARPPTPHDPARQEEAVLRAHEEQVAEALRGGRLAEARALAARAAQEVAVGSADARARAGALDSLVDRARERRARLEADAVLRHLAAEDLDGATRALDALRAWAGPRALSTDPALAAVAEKVDRWRQARGWEVARLRTSGPLDVEAAQNLLTLRLRAWTDGGTLFPGGGVALRCRDGAAAWRDLLVVEGTPAAAPLAGRPLLFTSRTGEVTTLALPLPLAEPLDATLDLVLEREPGPDGVVALLFGARAGAVGAVWGTLPARLEGAGAGLAFAGQRAAPAGLIGSVRLELRVEPAEAGLSRVTGSLRESASGRRLVGAPSLVPRDALRGELVLQLGGELSVAITGLEVRGLLDAERLR